MLLAEQSTMDDSYDQQLCPSVIKNDPESFISAESKHLNDRGRINSNCDVQKKTTIVRKRLGCRRSLKDIVSSEDQILIRSNDDMRKFVSGKTHQTLSAPCPLPTLKPNRRLIFTSPRVVASDEDLFPSNHSLYKGLSDRWQQISEQAGSHRQDGTVMNIGRRPSTAIAFRMGMIGYAAVRVRSLNLWLDHEKDTLKEWLEMIREVFINLEHITLAEDIFPGEDELTVSARMRRLYVLTILPNLKSIDDMVVTLKEREMANPGAYSDLRKYNKEKPQLQSGETITRYSDQGCDSMVEQSMVSDDVGSDKSSRFSGIEVEFSGGRFLYMNQMRTGISACSSPTTRSRLTTILVGIDDDIEPEEDNGMCKTEIFNDTIAIPPTPQVEKEVEKSHCKQRRTFTETQDLFSLPNDNRSVLTCRSNDDGMEASAPTRRTKHYPQKTVGDALKTNDVQSNKRIEENMLETRVRAFHNTSNNGIELVSIASTDLEWSATYDFLNFRKEKACAPRLRLPFSSTNSEMAFANELKESRTDSWDQEREKENSQLRIRAQKACTPVQRQSKLAVPTPQVGCCQILKTDPRSNSKFTFPTTGKRVSKNNHFSRKRISDTGVSSHKHLPPSISLSSHFTMHFRERQQSSTIISTPKLVVKTANSIDCHSRRKKPGRDDLIEAETENISSQLSVIDHKRKMLQNRELPPSRPLKQNMRKTTAIIKPKERNSERLDRQYLKDFFRESARSTSVMDLDDEEFFDHGNEEKHERVIMN